MPIISAISRKDPKTRVLIAAIYLALIIGATTMVYPFLLMISGSFKSSVDRQQWDIIPRYWFDDAMLFRKYVEARYNETLPYANTVYKARYFTFEKVDPPATIHERAVADWKAFLASVPIREDFQTLGFMFGFRIKPVNVR